ncbi:bifunctional phosphoribosyl-AMP cyclohydrolase/phosphoribosyl-ATP diphosphatase HisIE [Anthocerotibacter panamensis]|uniref:bifunctional phosphoribosyl-AMP cyclohydrolase/phosphoribosyl-ATP diphosphatase HisIE n=1 Tax=Anthocerotibacter panamensis TaxID=2857077 RepID=UPI001C40791D|nr:bifunctional phosphoribosyl-AMP cyclohydrolase/phosphoribosyl-ATP diphosphatase HisIE [Anthocerotibacter panamensis]
MDLATIRFNNQGLVPAIVQDYLDATVLMMAWMNAESLDKTLATGETWFWSRSRQQLWHKGATSGHLQKVHALRYDCDQDVLLLTVEQLGGIACHLGERSCFHQLEWPTAPVKSAPPADTLSQVFRVIQERKANPAESSYTSRLLAKGNNQILKKLGEETVEVAMAAVAESRERLVSEVSDLLYHTLVLLAHHDLDILEVYQELQQRRK